MKIFQQNLHFRPEDKSGELAKRVLEIQEQFRKEFQAAGSGRGRTHLKKVLRGWTLPWLDLELPESMVLKDPFDENGELLRENKIIQDLICVAVEARTRGCEVWVNIGIGGSDLPTQALVWSTINSQHNLLLKEARGGAPEIHFVGNDFSPEKILDLLKSLDQRGLLSKTLFNVVSKSGATQETLSAFLIVRDYLARKFHEEKTGRFFVATTGLNEKSLLFQLNKKDPFFAMLPVPEGTGGRFSVFSPVSLLALAVTANKNLGEDSHHRVIEAMDGVKDVIKNMLEIPATDERNVVFQAAMNHVVAETRKGKKLMMMVMYDPLLKQVGDLAQQIFSESLQKFGQGMDFLSIVGSDKMHSVWNGVVEGPGPERDLMVFVGTERTDETRDPLIPRGTGIRGKEIESMEGLHLSQVQRASMEGVMRDATDRGVLNYAILLPDRSVRNVAALIYLIESIVAVEGKLRGLEKEQYPDGTYKDFTYLQDGVEGYKLKTRDVLAKIKSASV